MSIKVIYIYTRRNAYEKNTNSFVIMYGGCLFMLACQKNDTNSPITDIEENSSKYDNGA